MWVAPRRCKGFFLRSNISDSTLVRLLGEWAAVDADASAMDFAERLGLWLNAFDAIGLQAAHQSIRTIKTAAPARPSDAAPTGSRAIAQDFQRARAALVKTIDVPLPGASYAAYRQRHLQLQREMEQTIAALRDRVRQALCRVSARLRQLAGLDAVLEQVLAPREQMLLPRVSALLARRFEQLRLIHRQALDAQGQQDDPALWRQPGGWLEVFDKEWRQALQAELDLRLEPVAGLIDAMSNELKNRE